MSKKFDNDDYDESKLGKPSNRFFGLVAILVGALLLIVLFLVFKDKIGQFFGF